MIVQPSIRLEDIDYVGLTLGRHLTSFEMGGHHAFNYPNKHVYWKEETVRLAFEFFTEELGVPPEHVTFKESWWEGGGNAGPSFEVTIGGLELATLVFMQYRIVNGVYEPIPLRVVDTGYGIERIAWFTQKVPTAFHAIYGSLLDEFHRLLGVEPAPRNLLWAAARDAGRLDPEDPASIKSFYERAARDAGLDPREAEEILQRVAAVYALLDHSKTIALMLADGIVPSNTGEGYLARLVIRRAIRLTKKLGSGISLVELVEKQARFWGSDYYPQMLENIDYILKVTKLEEERYKRSLDRGLREVNRLLRRKRSLALDDLILLYDSHGLPPDMVAEAAAKLGVKVDIPHNFYAIVAQRHGASGGIARRVEHPSLPKDIVEWLSGFPETERLFHKDPYLREFSAKILGIKGVYLVLDRTAFYPTGGGQLHDTGVVVLCGKEYRVKRVEKVGDVIVHVLDREPDKSCSEAKGRIDWERRYRLMRHHTGVHVVLGAARRVLGNHVWQAGAEKTPEKARLDITHYETLSAEEIQKIEELANLAILERIPVETRIMDRNDAEKLYGFRLYQGGVPLTPKLRVVRIGDWDVEACFGTHVANTAEIGSVKITKVEKLQDGVIRLELVAGSEVAHYASTLEKRINSIARIVGGGSADIEKRVEKLVRDYNSARQNLSRLAKYVVKQVIETLRKEPLVIEGLRVYVIREELPLRELYQEIARQISKEDPESITIALVPVEQGIVVEIGAGSKASRRINLREVAKQLNSRGFRGGGKPTHINMLAPSTSIEEVFEVVLSTLRSFLEEGIEK